MADLTGLVYGKDFANGATNLDWALCTAAHTLTGGYAYAGKNYVIALRFQMPQYAKSVTLGFFSISGANNGYDSKIRYRVTTQEDTAPNYSAADAGTDFIVNNPYERTELTINGPFLKGVTYYIYFWTAEPFSNSLNLFRTRWYTNVEGNGFYASFAELGVYTLTVNAGAGAVVTVNRIASAVAGGGVLGNGAQIFEGDVLSVTFGAAGGYRLISSSVNGAAFVSGGTCQVAGNVQVAAAAEMSSFVLTLQAVGGAAITVMRNGTQLGNGAAINYGDVLTVYYSTADGYGLGVHTVNGSSFPSGGTIEVRGNVTVAATGIANTYTLQVQQGTGVQISVLRNGSALSNGATVTYGDMLTVRFSAAAGYQLTAMTINGAAVEAECTHRVTGPVSVTGAAQIRTFYLNVSEAEGTQITVLRNGAELGQGAQITYGDRLAVYFSAKPGYTLGSCRVNGTEFPSGGTYDVTADVTVTAAAALQQYLLTVSAGNGGTVTVTRTASSGGETGQLNSGDVIYHGDVLKVEYAADVIHEVAAATINQNAFASGAQITVSGNVLVTVVFIAASGKIHICREGAFVPIYLFIFHGGSWDLYELYVFTGTDWELCD